MKSSRAYAQGETSASSSKQTETEYIATLQQQVYLLEVERDLLKKAREAQQRQAQQQPKALTADQPLDDILAALRNKFTQQETSYQSKLSELQSKVEELEIEIEARERVDEEITSALTNKTKGSATRGVSLNSFDDQESDAAKARRELVELKMTSETEIQTLREENAAKLQILRDHIAKQTKEIAVLQDRIGQLTDEQAKLTEEAEAYKAAASKDRSELVQVSNDVLALRKELATRTSQNKDLEQKRETLMETYTKLEQDYAQLLKAKNDAESRVRTLMLDLQASDNSDTNQLREVLKETQARTEALARDLSAAQTQIESRDRRLEKATLEINSLRQSLIAAEEATSAAQLRVGEIEGEVTVLRKQLGRSAATDDRYRLEMDYKTVVYERDGLIEKLAQRDAEILRLKKENAILDGKLNRSLAETLPAGYSISLRSTPQ